MLAKKPQLKTEIAKFKNLLRQVVIFCANPEGEDIFRSCRSPQNRLRAIAVDNKTASIQGMPVVNMSAAKLLVEHLLRLKGICNKSQFLAKKMAH